MPLLRLHDYALSGHAHRVRLLCSLLKLELECVPVDLRGGEQKQSAFVNMNVFGQVPVLEDGDLVVADSNAILLHLALRHDPDRRWWPQDEAIQVRIQQWFSAAAGPLAHGVARLRWLRWTHAQPERRAQELSALVLEAVSRQLERSPYLAGTTLPTLADIAMYSYLAAASQAGIALQAWPRIVTWLGAIESLDGFVAMPALP